MFLKVNFSFGKTKTENSSPVKQRLELDGVARSKCQQFYTQQGVTLANSQVNLNFNESI